MIEWSDKIGVSCAGWDIRLRVRNTETAIFWRRLDEGEFSAWQMSYAYSTFESAEQNFMIIRRLLERDAPYEKILNLVKAPERLMHYGDFT